MKIDELIKHLTNFKEKGYESYEVEVRNGAGNYVSNTCFTIDTENKKVKLF